MNSKELQNCIALKKDLLFMKKAIEQYFKSKTGVGKMSKGDKMLAEAHSLLLKQLTYNGILTNIKERGN
tara:strand:+ start:315 stop:521 length:207 start_codon:yes stop_codon:yes gene_type:complete